MVGSLQGPGPLARGVVLLQGSPPWPQHFSAGGQVDHRLCVAAGCPYSVQEWLKGCLQSSHSSHRRSLQIAGEAEGVEASVDKGCTSGVAQAAGAQLQ